MTKIRSILNAYPANVVVLDHRGIIRQANAAWKQLAKQSDASLDSYGVGSTFLQFCRNSDSLLADIANSAEKQIYQLLAGEISEFSEDYRSGARPNESRHLLHGHRMAIGRSGSPYFLITLQTITGRMAKQIDRPDGGMKRLLGWGQFVAWEANAKTGQCTYVGPQIETLLDYPPADWYKRNFWIRHLHPDDRARTTRAYRELSNGRLPYELQYRMLAKSGRTVWVRHFVTPEIRPGQQRLLRGALLDVTSVGKVEQRESLFQLLSESIEEIFWFVEINPERLVYISPAVERVMGWKPEKFYEDIGLWLQCVHEDDRSRVNEAYSGWLSGTLPEYRIEFRFKLPDGRIRWMADHGALLYGEGGAIKFATGIAKDISAQKEAEEDLRRLSGQLISAQEVERKRLARDLHDHVSQALTLLSVELEQLDRDHETTSSQHDVLTTMRNQLRALSSDLHALSHQLHPSKLKHLGLVSAMRAMCRELERAGLTVNFSDHEVPRQLPDDVSLTLYRVMQEGLQNIRKHSGVNSAEAELRKTSRFLILRLRDKGKGFNPHKITSGEGLGLSSMRERLNAIKGSLVIQSAPGHGTLLEAGVPLLDELEMRTT